MQIEWNDYEDVFTGKAGSFLFSVYKNGSPAYWWWQCFENKETCNEFAFGLYESSKEAAMKCCQDALNEREAA